MKPDELVAARGRLRLSQAALGDLIGVDQRTIRKWELGERSIPGPAAVLMEALLDGWRPRKA